MTSFRSMSCGKSFAEKAISIGTISFCLLAIVLGCRRPSTEWNGTWELDASKGTFPGHLLNISISSAGEYYYDDGLLKTNFRCDGEFRPIGNNRIENCVRSSATTLDRTRMENGAKTNLYHWEISSRGKFFTATAIAFRPTGAIVTGQIIAARVSGSDDFSGQWRDTRDLERYNEFSLRLDSRYLHVSYPMQHQYFDAPLDGTETAIQGTHASGEIYYAIQKVMRKEFVISEKHNGKVTGQVSLELNDKGNIITESWWSPNSPMVKSSFEYEKK